jgi:hypothetical protein
MPLLFDALPGQEVPVGGISAGFKKLWEDSPAQESRAVQLNLVLHLGSNTTPKDAKTQFQNTLKFAQRYPCRVVVLCPDFDEKAPAEIRAKIYGECFLGKSKNDTRCVEFVILHYTMSVRDHLEAQVSVCLSTDMPLYYWGHRFSSPKRLSDYDDLLTKSQRVLFDSTIAADDTFTFPWPNQSAVRDLAYTRTLPLRQNLGQFLSRYSPEAISGGLKKVTIRHRKQLSAEAASLLGWVKKGLARSGADVSNIAFEVVAEKGKDSASFAMEFGYQSKKKVFRWTADISADRAKFVGDLGSGKTTLEAAAHFLTPEMALAEAMFF